MGGASIQLEVRLARQLHLLLELSGAAVTADEQPTLCITQSELRKLLGVGRSRANFAVQQLKRLGLIELQYSNITNPAGLARLGDLSAGRLLRRAGP